MVPAFRPNQIIIASGWFHTVETGEVIIIQHHNLEKIKRIEQVDPLRGVFVVGDNALESTDSRSFGWIDFDEIIAKVRWPAPKKLG